MQVASGGELAADSLQSIIDEIESLELKELKKAALRDEILLLFHRANSSGADARALRRAIRSHRAGASSAEALTSLFRDAVCVEYHASWF